MDEPNRLWRDAPDKRGTALLFLTATMRGTDRSYADPRWADFKKRYGEGVSQRVFADFLDQGANAMMAAPVVWLALSKGWSRAEVIVPRLSAFFADPATTRAKDGEPARTLRAIAGRVCDDGDGADLARLHAALEARVRAHPAKRAALDGPLAHTSGCKGGLSRVVSRDRTKTRAARAGEGGARWGRRGRGPRRRCHARPRERS